MTGRLQVKNNRYYMIINMKNTDGRYKQKWYKTGLSVQNNRRKAEQMLRDKLIEFDALAPGADAVFFEEFAVQWLGVKKIALQRSTYEMYKLIINHHLSPHFSKLNKKIDAIKPNDIQDYFNLKLDCLCRDRTPNIHRACPPVNSQV